MIVGLLAGLIAVSAVQDSGTSPRARWSLRVDPAFCTLERIGSEPYPFLTIDTVPGSDNYRVAIAGGDVKGPEPRTPASLKFAPTQEAIKGFAFSAKLPDGTPAVLMQRLPPSLLDQLVKAGAIFIATGSEVRAAVQVSGTAAAIAALRKCNAEQLVEWGAEAGQFAPGGKTPVALTSRDDWISNSDLVRIARQTKRGEIKEDFRVGINAEGVIDDCRALGESSDSAMAARTACAAVTGKRLFDPARDSDGRPLRGVATFHIGVERRYEMAR